jgi:hypothetical protein
MIGPSNRAAAAEASGAAACGAASGLVTGDLAGRSGDPAIGAEGAACRGARGPVAAAWLLGDESQPTKPLKSKVANASRRRAGNRAGPNIRATLRGCFAPTSANGEEMKRPGRSGGNLAGRVPKGADF